MSEHDEELAFLREEVGRLREQVSRLTPPLTALLKMRSYHVYKQEPMESPLLPPNQFADKYYDCLRHYSFRLFLRDVIKFQDGFTEQDITRYATRTVTKDYIKTLQEMLLAEKINDSYRLTGRPVRSFGPTLEWFVAKIFERDFRTEAIWGVRFKRAYIGGDYDVIAKLDGGIVYVEVKSSPPKQIYQSEIAAFYRRVEDLAPEIAVFFVDTELRMKDKIVPMFEEELNNRTLNLPVVRMEKELFHISNKIFIINSKGGISLNLEKVIRWHFLYNK